jgi:hypothetical protein
MNSLTRCCIEQSAASATEPIDSNELSISRPTVRAVFDAPVRPVMNEAVSACSSTIKLPRIDIG